MEPFWNPLAAHDFQRQDNTDYRVQDYDNDGNDKGDGQSVNGLRPLECLNNRTNSVLKSSEDDAYKRQYKNQDKQKHCNGYENLSHACMPLLF